MSFQQAEKTPQEKLQEEFNEKGGLEGAAARITALEVMLNKAKASQKNSTLLMNKIVTPGLNDIKYSLLMLQDFQSDTVLSEDKKVHAENISKVQSLLEDLLAKFDAFKSNAEVAEVFTTCRQHISECNTAIERFNELVAESAEQIRPERSAQFSWESMTSNVEALGAEQLRIRSSSDIDRTKTEEVTIGNSNITVELQDKTWLDTFGFTDEYRAGKITFDEIVRLRKAMEAISYANGQYTRVQAEDIVIDGTYVQRNVVIKRGIKSNAGAAIEATVKKNVLDNRLFGEKDVPDSVLVDNENLVQYMMRTYAGVVESYNNNELLGSSSYDIPQGKRHSNKNVSDVAKGTEKQRTAAEKEFAKMRKHINKLALQPIVDEITQNIKELKGQRAAYREYMGLGEANKGGKHAQDRESLAIHFDEAIANLKKTLKAVQEAQTTSDCVYGMDIAQDTGIIAATSVARTEALNTMLDNTAHSLVETQRKLQERSTAVVEDIKKDSTAALTQMNIMFENLAVRYSAGTLRSPLWEIHNPIYREIAESNVGKLADDFQKQCDAAVEKVEKAYQKELVQLEKYFNEDSAAANLDERAKAKIKQDLLEKKEEHILLEMGILTNEIRELYIALDFNSPDSHQVIGRVNTSLGAVIDALRAELGGVDNILENRGFSPALQSKIRASKEVDTSSVAAYDRSKVGSMAFSNRMFEALIEYRDRKGAVANLDRVINPLSEDFTVSEVSSRVLSRNAVPGSLRAEIEKIMADRMFVNCCRNEESFENLKRSAQSLGLNDTLREQWPNLQHATHEVCCKVVNKYMQGLSDAQNEHYEGLNDRQRALLKGSHSEFEAQMTRTANARAAAAKKSKILGQVEMKTSTGASVYNPKNTREFKFVDGQAPKIDLAMLKEFDKDLNAVLKAAEDQSWKQRGVSVSNIRSGNIVVRMDATYDQEVLSKLDAQMQRRQEIFGSFGVKIPDFKCTAGEFSTCSLVGHTIKGDRQAKGAKTLEMQNYLPAKMRFTVTFPRTLKAFKGAMNCLHAAFISRLNDTLPFDWKLTVSKTAVMRNRGHFDANYYAQGLNYQAQKDAQEEHLVHTDKFAGGPAGLGGLAGQLARVQSSLIAGSVVSGSSDTNSIDQLSLSNPSAVLLSSQPTVRPLIKAEAVTRETHKPRRGSST